MSRRAFLILTVAATLVIAVGALAVVRARVDPATPSQPPSFRVGQVTALDPADAPRAGRGAQVGEAIVRFLNGYYDLAFNPSRWTESGDEASGTPAAGGDPVAELQTLFTERAAAEVDADLEALALGEVAGKIRGLQPERSEATSVTVLLQGDLSAPFVIASVIFDAEAEEIPPEASFISRALNGPPQGAPVTIRHRATLWLIPHGESFRIMAYSANLEVAGGAAAAAFGATEVPR